MMVGGVRTFVPAGNPSIETTALFASVTEAVVGTATFVRAYFAAAWVAALTPISAYEVLGTTANSSGVEVVPFTSAKVFSSKYWHVVGQLTETMNGPVVVEVKLTDAMPEEFVVAVPS
jgi:hypothetical protein